MKWLIFALLSFNIFAADCTQFTEDLPVLSGGRVKPFFVFAKENMKFITGKSSYLDRPATETICQIILAGRLGTAVDLPVLVEHVDSKKLLGLTEDENTKPASELVDKTDLIRSEIFKQKESNSYQKDLNKVFARIDTYKKIKSGEAFQLFLGGNIESGWATFNQVSDDDLDRTLANSSDAYKTAGGKDVSFELTFVKSHIFSYAMLVALIGIFVTVLFKNMNWGIGLGILVALIEVAGIAMRVMISGRAPITNMYETVLFSGFGALVISLIVLFFKKDKTFLLAGLGYNILCLFMMMFANNMLDSKISPLVPVLRDNFWLSTHVTTIILSYAALALSWLVANMTLVKMRFGTLTKKDYRYYQDLTYTCIKIGVVLLAAGIILGGVWADYSWGRFWGWDPKETWSLIVLLFYMVIIHGKYSSWIDTHRFVVLSAAGFMSVMMAWFGVNYILASGLHSYGFSEGGAVFLGSFFLAQTIIILICGTKKNFKEAI